MAGQKARLVICLFRNDLRFHDNQMLHWAHRNADFVLPLYCFDPRHLKDTWHYHFPKTGPHRLRFLLDTVRDLRQTLQQHGSGLIVREGEPEKLIPDLIKRLSAGHHVHTVALQKEVTKEELDVETALISACTQHGVEIKLFWGMTLYHRDDLPFDPKQTPNVYTEFRKSVENRCSVRPLVDMPAQLRPLPGGVEGGDIPDYSAQVSLSEPDPRSAFPFRGGETAALERLQYYLWGSDKVASYKETRNGMVGPDYSTKFSPWLALGSLSPRQIYWEMKRYEEQRTANQSTYWVIFELLWRDYFKFVAIKFGDRLFYKSGLLGKHVPWRVDMNLFNAWKDGRTGVPYVDANMRELKVTGFMSNRGRQNVASYLTKDLKLDWRLGAEWFESLLVDHDVCSNYGNWLYSAGIGNDPRQDRKFNMIKQGLDYDSSGEYVRHWVEELKGISGGDIHRVWTLPSGLLSRAGISIGLNYPYPVVVAPEWARHFGKSVSTQMETPLLQTLWCAKMFFFIHDTEIV
ncbi:cryptochrome DASH-like [Liolophura sinensis]|uniref:cryptochrome DASH-like n=1 Tax=Liolophura sinensis TaxID=3198878 RepID=UPI003157F5E4